MAFRTPAVNPLANQQQAAQAAPAFIPPANEAYGEEEYTPMDPPVQQAAPAPAAAPAPSYAVPAPAQTQALSLPPAGTAMAMLDSPDYDGGWGEFKPVGFGAAEQLKIEAGQFFLGTTPLGPEVLLRVVSKRDHWIVRQHAGDGADCVWTDDLVNTTDGRTVDEVVAQWRAEGHSPVKADRLELKVIVMKEGYNEKLVIADLPQTSIGRFELYRQNLALFKGRHPHQVITKAKADVARGKGRTWPVWTFEFASLA